MANGLDRLERLFAYKRKASPSPNGRRTASTVPSFDQQFPSPSFIRPKTSRMTARQEVRLGQATERSPSVPDIYSAQRAGHSHTFGSVSGDSNYQLKHRLGRSPSFGHRQTETSGLHEFQFPKPPSRNGDASPLSLTFSLEDLVEAPRLPSPRRRSPLEISIPSTYQLDTPPSSEPEDNGLDATSPTAKGPQFSLSTCLPTPDLSPEVGPVDDTQLRSVKSADCLDRALFHAIEDQLGEPFDHVSLGRTCSQSSIAHSARSFCSSTLREPDVNEFLSLSDDDIAEDTPDSPALEPLEEADPSTSPLDRWISSSDPPTPRLLTLTPPRASRPAAAAAFEAARIARRYDFDLVYVVNLWPDTSCPGTSTQKPMVGRLLAAHGLHHVPTPLQIAADVHTTVLRSDGWIEYRNEEALPQDIARGYACAFYTGQYATSTSSHCTGPVSGIRLSERIDRGIVFAGYRKPRDDDGKLGRTFGDAELGKLHEDAEVLVEMVIDIHVANRNRQSSSRNCLTDDIGPIPMQQTGMA